MRFEQENCPECGHEPCQIDQIVPVKYGLVRRDDGSWEIEGNDVAHEFAGDRVEGQSRLICSACGEGWISRNQDGTGKPMIYRVTATHDSGQSVAHSCTGGIYEDPANEFDELIEATSLSNAIAQAAALMRETVDQWEPCGCRRKAKPGTDRWWESLTFSAWL